MARISLPPDTALNVAKYFLYKANTEGDLITNLKMQKLLYYAQAWHLVNYHAPLFRNKIVAWNFGPVITSVYHHFKDFEAKPILYTETGREAEKFNPKQLKYLNEFYDYFIKFTAHELVNMSHNEFPWEDAYKNNKSEISLEVMKKHYSNLLKSSKQ